MKERKSNKAPIAIPERTNEFYADEQTKRVYETAQKAVQTASKIPPEGLELARNPITFKPEYEEEGLAVVFAVGGFLPCGEDERVIQVPDRTLKVLAEMGIPYQIS